MSNTNTAPSKGNKELTSRLLFLLVAILVYRLGTYIPIPGIDMTQIQDLINQTQDDNQTIFDMGNLFSGGAISRMSIFSLGLMPYITASIVMQLLSHMPGKLKELRTSGSAGRKKISQYTRYFTFVIAFAQGIAFCLGFQQGYALYSGPAFWLVGAFCFAVGSLFLMWLGEQITERGVGNGISMLIFVGIVASMPTIFGGMISDAREGNTSIGLVLGIFVLLVALFFLIVYVERSQRRIPIHYARQQAGMGQKGMQNNYLPLKVNLAGVIPAIFASAIIILIGTVLKFLSENGSVAGLFDGSFGRYANDIAGMVSSGQPTYVILYGILIIGFSFFYTGLMFENKELSEDLKRSGAFIQGVRPGRATAEYIDMVQNRLTLVGALYVAFVVLLPEVFNMNSSNQALLVFGGTSLLIMVVVAMDFVAQVQSHLLSKQYQSMMKKSHLGRRRV